MRNGELVWSADYDIYGRLKNVKGERTFIPFRQAGQIEDSELEGLYYNRYRWYNSETGCYISQDPIGLAGNNPTLYGYVFDPNIQIDPFGLDCSAGSKPKKRGLKKLNKFREKGVLEEASNGHLNKHKMSINRIQEIIDSPDHILYNNNNTNLLFHKEGDVVVVNTKENKIITSFGASDKDGIPVNIENLKSDNKYVQLE